MIVYAIVQCIFVSIIINLDNANPNHTGIATAVLADGLPEYIVMAAVESIVLALMAITTFRSY